MTEQNAPLVVAYGMGVDSTAALVELHRRGIRPDLILFADIGDEKRETYAYRPIIDRWLQSVDFPAIQVVTNQVKNFKNWPPYETLAQNCLTNGTLPGLVFGGKSCSEKWKIRPQNKFTDGWQPAVDAWARGQRVRKIIGYDASPKDAKRYNHSLGKLDPKYDYWYPLMDWGMAREDCKDAIRAAGLPVPPKSACVYCPSTQPEELHTHKKEYLRMIVMLEARAKPRLEGHMNQDQLNARHSDQLGDWTDQSYRKLKPAGLATLGMTYRSGKKLNALPKLKKEGTFGMVQGLWRGGIKGVRSGKPRPAMMTTYILDQGLLGVEEVERIQNEVPAEIIHNQERFANGLEIPDWHDFIQTVTEEDAVEEGQACTGCECYAV